MTQEAIIIYEAHMTHEAHMAHEALKSSQKKQVRHLEHR